jgi:hypothetical protein
MRRAPIIWLAAAAAPTLALAGAGCETVNLGDPPADINSCRPSQNYYVGNASADGGALYGGIWQNLLDKDYGGGKKCTNDACHGAASTNSLKLTMPTGCIPPGCTVPIPLTQEWATNYRATAEQMNCANVSASRLLTLPGGLVPHGGQKLFDAASSPEADLILGWVGAFP